MLTCNAIRCFVAEYFSQDCRLLKYTQPKLEITPSLTGSTIKQKGLSLNKLKMKFRAAVRHSKAFRSDKPNCSILISTET